MTLSPYKKRLRILQSKLKSFSKSSAALVSSAPPAVKSRDISYPFRQSSSLYYLTGIRERSAALIVYADGRTSQLITQKNSSWKETWLGPGESLLDRAQQLNCVFSEALDPVAACLDSLQVVDHLFFENVPGSVSLQVAERLIILPQFQRRSQPAHFSHLEIILEGMRVIKDKSEILAMTRAANLAADAFLAVVPRLRLGMSEDSVRGLLLGEIYSRGGAFSFNPVIGSGRGSAYPHYSGGAGVLSSGDLLLLDWGAEVEMYQSDMTRVVPISGRFQGKQRTLYEIVLEAQSVAISLIRPGAKLKDINNTAVRTLTEGLVDLGVLKGRIEELVERKAYSPFFPQDGVSHPIGLDVQEVGARRSRVIETLREGMVITVEPALYFPEKRPRGLTSCGVRIEDMVEVTKSGARILTSTLPKQAEDIEALITR